LKKLRNELELIQKGQAIESFSETFEFETEFLKFAQPKLPQEMNDNRYVAHHFLQWWKEFKQ
jgi:hypothetical protein